MKQALFVVFAASTIAFAQQPGSTSLLTRIDHLVYATPDLQRGIDAIEKRLQSSLA